jgi:hypothetical protein
MTKSAKESIVVSFQPSPSAFSRQRTVHTLLLLSLELWAVG